LATASEVQKQTASNVRDWKGGLRRVLTTSGPDSRIALVGVGHPLRGDDYVGSFIVKALKHECRTEHARFFDAEDDVEKIVSKVVEFNPLHVVFMDACEMNAIPGETALVSMSETDYPFFTTHGIPLKLLANQLLPNSQAWILAVQPEQTEFSNRLSSRVREAALSVSSFIVDTLKEAY
jgi:hydrogenase 3 maturation protease